MLGVCLLHPSTFQSDILAVCSLLVVYVWNMRLLICILIFSLAICLEEHTIAQVKPVFESQVVYITTGIIIQTPSGETNFGTGFFYGFEIELESETKIPVLLLLSNAHVFEDSESQMTINVNKRKEDGSPDHGNTKKMMFPKLEDLYYRHPNKNVDLATIDVTRLLYDPSLYFKNVWEELLTPINYDVDVVLGQDVLFVGYPRGHYDKVNNLPLARRGILSSMPNVNFGGEEQLVIDAEVFEGSSGSPVFVEINGKYKLLGVLRASLPTVEVCVGPNMSVQIKQHIGLGLVIKQGRVRELIDHVKDIKTQQLSGK